MFLDEVLHECEVVYIDKEGNTIDVLDEGARRAYKRIGSQIKRVFRCTSGRKKGKLVSDPSICGKRKDPRKVRVGKRVARTKKGIRIRKSGITRKTAKSKVLRKMNARLSGTGRPS